MIKRSLILGVLALLGFSFLSEALADEFPWQERLDKENIKVSVRKQWDSPILEFKAGTIISKDINKVTAFFEDEKKLSEWYYQSVTMDFLEDEGPLSKIYYFVVHLSWPLAKRDSVIRRVKEIDPHTGVITYEITLLPDKMLKQRGKIRVTHLNMLWRFTPLSNGQTEVYFQQHGSPGGSIPIFIINAVILDIPFYSLQNLRRLVEEEKE